MSAARFRAAPDVAWVGDEWADDEEGTPIGVVVVAVLPDGPVHLLEGPAATVWDLAIGQAVDDLVEAVADVYGEPPSAVAFDVTALVEDLLARGLIEHER